MKITMYDLLGMVKDGKSPKKIKYDNIIWEYDGIYYITEYTYLDEYCDISRCLNDEVEIIEEEIIEEEKKIPEKLTDILKVDDLIPPVDENMYKIWKQTIKNHNKINEICDYLKSKGE